jgi:hypothetical protein
METVERVLQILREGSVASTYKHAVLIALMDLCIEKTKADGSTPQSLTTRELAVKVIELYWHQTRPWGKDDGAMLRQTTQRGRSIPHMVHSLRSRMESQPNSTMSAARVRFAEASSWNALVDEVEWRLIEMPLAKLQRVANQHHSWLYTISWDDEANRPTKAGVRAYQLGESSDFDNLLRLQPGVSECLSRMHALMRPFVQQEWARMVATCNRLADTKLHDFLFGANRAALDSVRKPLTELQHGKCFYCQGSLGAAAQVDHFLPWARFAEDGLANLVVADARCNGDKRDHLPAHPFVARWRQRAKDNEAQLSDLSRQLSWNLAEHETLGSARAAYLRLPPDTQLWAGRKQWESADTDALRKALA